MDFNADYFELFALPQRFTLDLYLLERRYRELQARIHPDRFVNGSEQEKRLSLQWATYANEAYQTLRTPLARAQYLLGLHGYDVNASHVTIPEAFLVEQMTWRERIAEAAMDSDIDTLTALHDDLLQQIRAQYMVLTELLDEKPQYEMAFERVRQLMFMERLKHDADEAISALEE